MTKPIFELIVLSYHWLQARENGEHTTSGSAVSFKRYLYHIMGKDWIKELEFITGIKESVIGEQVKFIYKYHTDTGLYNSYFKKITSEEYIKRRKESKLVK